MSERAHSAAVIGAGAVGRALAQALSENGVRVEAVISRTAGPASHLADAVGAPVSGSDLRALPAEIDVLFLCVPDDEIERVDAALARDVSILPRYVGHTSGTRASSDLVLVRRKGCAAFSFHPVQTFAADAGPADFHGIPITIEGDEEARTATAAMATRIGARPVLISRTQKQDLHAAAVVASNYMVALQHLAIEVGTASGLDEAMVRALLAPLIAKTAHNISTSGTVNALTGPIARGDVATVRRHLLRLRSLRPDLAALYAALGRETTRLALGGRRISPTQAHDLLHALEPYQTGTTSDNSADSTG